MDRRNFIKTSFGASLGTLGLVRPGISSVKSRDSILANIVRANDHNVERLLNNYSRMAASSGGRVLSGFLLSVSAAYCSAESDYYHSRDLITPMLAVTMELKNRQNPNGTFDFGNLQSPPDSGFMVEQFFRVQALLIKDASSETVTLREGLKEVMLNTAEALITGGVHTPNHRWAICAALAGVHSIYPDERYVNRIDDWLGEGIGQDSDGQHPERSPNYDSAVNNPSLLDVSIYLNRPELLEPVRRNLEMTLFLLEPNGEVDTIASRRQDAGRVFMIYRYYLPFRFMAILDKNPRFAEVARFIEANAMPQLGTHLADFMLHDTLQNELPQSGSLSENYSKHLRNSHLVRIRRGNKSAAIYGGTDWHLGHGVWSGLSHNPTFFKMRKGDAILDSVRMAPAFFSTGYFRSTGLEVNENSCHLTEERQTPYHQPLPQQFRKDDGFYKMSPDGRFFSMMDFENRPKDYIQLKTDVIIRELNNSGAFELEITAEKTPNVAYTIELCFRKGGELSGVIPQENDPDGYFLKEGTGRYTVGNDMIEFGPGKMEHGRPPRPNEQYSVHNGTIRAAGYRVLITLVSPFQYTLRLT
jgi:hypothetical protein